MIPSRFYSLSLLISLLAFSYNPRWLNDGAFSPSPLLLWGFPFLGSLLNFGDRLHLTPTSFFLLHSSFAANEEYGKNAGLVLE
jgi:hypothetical protein